MPGGGLVPAITVPSQLKGCGKHRRTSGVALDVGLPLPLLAALHPPDLRAPFDTVARLLSGCFNLTHRSAFDACVGMPRQLKDKAQFGTGKAVQKYKSAWGDYVPAPVNSIAAM